MSNSQTLHNAMNAFTHRWLRTPPKNLNDVAVKMAGASALKARAAEAAMQVEGGNADRGRILEIHGMAEDIERRMKRRLLGQSYPPSTNDVA